MQARGIARFFPLAAWSLELTLDTYPYICFLTVSRSCFYLVVNISQS